MKLEQICEVPTDEHSPDGKTLYKPCGKDYTGVCVCDETLTCKYYQQWRTLEEKNKEGYIERVINWWRGL